jgi:hypothetical protein
MLIKTVLRTACFIISIWATTFFSIIASAQTSDGLTPAQENVCVGFGGAARGLCNAYCEAMDCDSDEAAASQTACNKVAARFLNITGQMPPCELATCPCEAMTVVNIVAQEWIVDSTVCHEVLNGNNQTQEAVHIGDFATQGFVELDAQISGFGNTCSVDNLLVDGTPVFEFPPRGISDAEAAACLRILREAAQQMVASGKMLPANNNCSAP